jgi:hypothetical protein
MTKGKRPPAPRKQSRVPRQAPELITTQRERRRKATAEEREAIEFATEIVLQRLRSTGEAPPQYLLAALHKFAAKERDRRDRLGVRGLVLQAHAAGASLSSPHRSRPGTAFDIVASELGCTADWVYDAYHYPGGRKKP